MASQKVMLGPYIVVASLGEGGYAKVKLGVHEKTGEKVALKVLKNLSKMDKNSVKQLEREFQAFSKLNHPNVLKMKDYLVDCPYRAADGRETTVNVFVLELAPNGELFDFISFTGAFEEGVARTFFHQLIAGLEHCHEEGIYHRDIKPENLLLGEDYSLKIADFGLSNAIQNIKGAENLMYTVCGTSYYMAPELSSRGYDPARVDIWACGVVLFVILAKSPPFEKTQMSDWYYNKLATNRHALFWQAHSRGAYFSEHTKDFINKIFHPDPSKRLSIADMKKHPWWNGPTLTEEALNAELLRRKKLVDKEKEQEKERKAAGAAAGAAVVRGEGGSPDDDELPDALPSFAIEPIIYKQPIHAPISEDASFDDLKKDWNVRSLPDVTRFTRFPVKEGFDTPSILSRVVDVLNVKKCKYSSPKDNTPRLNVQTGPSNFVVEVFLAPDSKKDQPKYIVDFRRGVGGDQIFRSHYADIRASLGDVVAQPVASASPVVPPGVEILQQ